MEWDAIKWANEYRKSSLERRKQLLIDVWNDTLKIVRNGRYFSGEETLIDSSKVAENTLFYRNKQFLTDVDIRSKLDRSEKSGFTENTKEQILEQSKSLLNDMKISVLDIDCLEAARFMNNPVVLNMASYKNPGGGVVNGSAAQEENIFRRTNLFKSLYQFVPYGGNYGIEKHPTFGYPLLGLDGIYSKDVTVFRGSEKNGYYLLNSPFNISVISVCAIKRPELKDGKIGEHDLKLNTQKIKTIFNIAIENGHTDLVLSAFGCGSYGNPPEQIAKIFKDLLDNEYRDYFNNIVFAIFDDHNCYKEHNPDGNLKPFQEIFNK